MSTQEHAALFNHCSNVMRFITEMPKATPMPPCCNSLHCFQPCLDVGDAAGGDGAAADGMVCSLAAGAVNMLYLLQIVIASVQGLATAAGCQAFPGPNACLLPMLVPLFAPGQPRASFARTISELPLAPLLQIMAHLPLHPWQLVAACDLAVASSSAAFATPGVHIGLFCSTPSVRPFT